MTKLATVIGLCVLIVVAGGAAVYFGRAAMDSTTTLEISTVTATATTTVTNETGITDYSVCFSPDGGCARRSSSPSSTTRPPRYS